MTGKARHEGKAAQLIAVSKAIERTARELRQPQRPEILADRLGTIMRLCGEARLHAMRTGELPTVERIQRDVDDPLADVLASLQQVLGEVLEARPFALFVFTERLTNYVSNAERGDVVEALREFVAAHDVSGPEPGAA